MHLYLCLNQYKEEIRARKASFRCLQRLNVHLPFISGSQFLCFAHSETKFQLGMDKPMLIPKADCYKGKKKLIEDDKDAPPTRYVKAKPNRLFKREVAVLHQKELTSRNWQALQRYYKLGAHCSGLEPEEKPPLKGVHHKTGRCYQTINRNPLVVDSPSNCVCQWKKDFVVVSERNFSFTVELPNSTFTFIHQVQPIIEEVNSNYKAPTTIKDTSMEVYDGPPPSQKYVHFLEKTLLRTTESLVEALYDRAHAKIKAKRWKMLGEFLFYKLF